MRTIHYLYNVTEASELSLICCMYVFVLSVFCMCVCIHVCMYVFACVCVSMHVCVHCVTRMLLRQCSSRAELCVHLDVVSPTFSSASRATTWPAVNRVTPVTAASTEPIAPVAGLDRTVPMDALSTIHCPLHPILVPLPTKSDYTEHSVIGIFIPIRPKIYADLMGESILYSCV